MLPGNDTSVTLVLHIMAEHHWQTKRTTFPYLSSSSRDVPPFLKHDSLLFRHKSVESLRKSLCLRFSEFDPIDACFLLWFAVHAENADVHVHMAKKSHVTRLEMFTD